MKASDISGGGLLHDLLLQKGSSASTARIPKSLSFQRVKESIRYALRRIGPPAAQQPKSRSPTPVLPALSSIRHSFKHVSPKPSSLTPTPGFQFSQLPRFGNDVESLLNVRCGSSQSPKLQDNKKLAQYTPEQRRESFRIKSNQKEYKMLLYKQMKQALSDAKRDRLARQLNEKFLKLEYKVNHVVYDFLRQRWISALALVSLVTASSFHIRFRKARQARVRHRLAWLCAVSLCLGRFKSALRRTRRRRARRTLTSLLKPLVHVRVAELRRSAARRVDGLVLKMIGDGGLVQVIHVWKLRLLLIQRSLRSWLLITAARVEAIGQLLVKAYTQVYSNPLPSIIVKYHATRYLRYTLQQYLNDRTYYQTHKARLKVEYAHAAHQHALETVLGGRPQSTLMPKPKPPTFRLYSLNTLIQYVSDNIPGTLRQASPPPPPEQPRRSRAASVAQSRPARKKHTENPLPGIDELRRKRTLARS